MSDDDDDVDDELIWDRICQKPPLIRTEAKAILDAAGFHAFGHTGIVEAVVWGLRKPKLA